MNPLTGRLLLMLIFGLSIGCAASRNRLPDILATPAGPVAETVADTADDTATAATNGAQSLLRPGFAVSVTVIVAGTKEIDEAYKRVADDGKIALPLLGSVEIAGLSLRQAAARIQQLYADYFVNPQVVLEFARGDDSLSPWGHVTVLGRVSKPGRVALPATRDMTLSGVIQRAGGFASSAKDTAIRITRRGPDGEAVTFEINLRAVGSRGRIENDIIIQPDDVVFVPELIF